MAPRRPRKNDEAVESLIRNPSSKTDFRSIGNQQVRINLMFLHVKHLAKQSHPSSSKAYVSSSVLGFLRAIRYYLCIDDV